MFTDVFFIAGVLCYTLALIVAWREQSAWFTPRRLQRALVALGFIHQTMGLYFRGAASQRCPIGDPFEMMQFIAWSLIVIYWLVGTAFRSSILGLFTAGLAVLLSGIGVWWGLVMEKLPSASRTAATYLIELHASLAFFSYGVFGMLAVTSILYVLQNWGLKRKQWQGLFARLPPIRQLQAINQRLLYVGTSVFSVALGLGALHWLRHPESITLLKMIFTLTIWSAYLLLSGWQLLGHLPARRQAWMCIVLFGGALLALYAVDQSRQKPELTSLPF